MQLLNETSFSELISPLLKCSRVYTGLNCLPIEVMVLMWIRSAVKSRKKKVFVW